MVVLGDAGSLGIRGFPVRLCMSSFVEDDVGRVEMDPSRCGNLIAEFSGFENELIESFVDSFVRIVLKESELNCSAVPGEGISAVNSFGVVCEGICINFNGEFVEIERFVLVVFI